MGEDNFWLCERCAKTYSNPGDCAVHPDEPLLDVRSEAVVMELIAIDDKARDAIMNRWMLLLGVTGFVFAFLMQNAGRSSGSSSLFPLTISPGLGAIIGRIIAQQRFQPRFRAWTAPVDPLPSSEEAGEKLRVRDVLDIDI